MGVAGVGAWQEHAQPRQMDGSIVRKAPGQRSCWFFIPLPQGVVLLRAGVGPLQLRAIEAVVLRSENTLWGLVTYEVRFSFRSELQHYRKSIFSCAAASSLPE